MESYESKLIADVEREVRLQRSLKLHEVPERPLEPIRWGKIISEQPSRFIRPDGSLIVETLRNFKKVRLLLANDDPAFDPQKPSLKTLIGGGRRGVKKLLRGFVRILKERGYGYLLKKYSPPAVGNRYTYHYNGYSLTVRWCLHLYYVGLLNQILGSKHLGAEFTTVDIGSGHGDFSYLLKREYPKAHCVLVDFPEQLAIARYQLGMLFPEARMAGTKEIAGLESIPRSFLESHDVTFVPHKLYPRLPAGSIDLVTNFTSFGEMTKEWFHYYVDAPVFKTAKWFMTANRIISRPGYDSDLTILDYPTHKPLHFGLHPLCGYNYTRHKLFFTRRGTTSSPVFEYIGQQA